MSNTASIKEHHIDGITYELPSLKMSASKLLYWESNPRIYEKIRRRVGGENISQDEIHDFFIQEVDSVNNLKSQIAKAGGINVSLFIQKAENSSDHIVFEGNTRLAAVREMHFRGLHPYKDDDLIPVYILPDDMDVDLINTVVGQEQLQTKKDWDAFEMVSYVAREYQKRRNNQQSDKQIYSDMKREFDVTQARVKSSVEIINFMKENELEKTMKGVNRFSHWNFYKTNREHQKLAKLYNEKSRFNEIATSSASKPFDKLIIDIVMDDDVPKAVDFRDQLTKIAKEYDRDKSPAENLISKKYGLSHIASMISEDDQKMYAFLDTTYEKLVSPSFDNKLLSEKLNTDGRLKTRVKKIITKLTIHVDLAKAIGEGKTTTDKFKKINILEANTIADHYYEMGNLPKEVKKSHLKKYFKDKKSEISKGDMEIRLQQTTLPEEDLKNILNSIM